MGIFGSKKSSQSSQDLAEEVHEQVRTQFATKTDSINSSENFAKNSTDKMRREPNIKIMEETAMSETAKNENAEKNTKANKTPATKKDDQQKTGFFAKLGGWWKRNWRYVATGAGGVVVGAAGTYGVGKLGESMAAKKAAARREEE